MRIKIHRLGTINVTNYANKVKSLLWSIVRGMLLMGISFIIIYPILYMVSMSLKVRPDLFDASVVWIPKYSSFPEVIKTYRHVIKVIQYWQYLQGTVVFTLVTTAIHIVISCVVGYGFAKFDFKGKKLFFQIVILTMLIPPITTIIPMFLRFRYFDFFGIIQVITGQPGINLNVGMWPSVLLGATGFGLKNGLYIFIFRQYFKGQPKELEEAAYIDGSGVFKTFYSVHLPLCGSSILIVAIFSAVWQWTDSFYTSIFSKDIHHIMSALPSLRVSLQSIGNWSQVDVASTPIYTNAGIFLAILPLIIFYIFVQRYFIQGIEKSGLIG